MSKYEGVNYSSSDTVDGLSEGQLELIINSDNSFLISFLVDRTRADAHRIRLMLEMGQIEARRRREAP